MSSDSDKLNGIIDLDDLELAVRKGYVPDENTLINLIIWTRIGRKGAAAWIPCAVRMPTKEESGGEYGGYVWAFAKKWEKPQIVECHILPDGSVGFGGEWCGAINDATHWYPIFMPQPPK